MFSRQSQWEPGGKVHNVKIVIANGAWALKMALFAVGSKKGHQIVTIFGSALTSAALLLYLNFLTGEKNWSFYVSVNFS